jgi:hypothetical protein
VPLNSVLPSQGTCTFQAHMTELVGYSIFLSDFFFKKGKQYTTGIRRRACALHVCMLAVLQIESVAGWHAYRQFSHSTAEKHITRRRQATRTCVATVGSTPDPSLFIGGTTRRHSSGRRVPAVRVRSMHAKRSIYIAHTRDLRSRVLLLPNAKRAGGSLSLSPVTM